MKTHNYIIETCENVYSPAEDTDLLINNLSIRKNDKILEIGTGTGIISIYASKFASKIIAIDINPYALECAKKNIEKNNITNIQIKKSDMFQNINEKFDLILFNTPYLPVQEEINDYLDLAWNGGQDGRKIIDPFLDQVKKYLNMDGKVQLVQSSLSNNEKTIKKLEKLGFNVTITANQHLFFEEIVVITAQL